MGMRDGDADGAGFFLQQALEKYLKAFLLSQGWKLKKVHTLQSLLDEAAAFMPDLSALAAGLRTSVRILHWGNVIPVSGKRDCNSKTFGTTCRRLGR